MATDFNSNSSFLSFSETFKNINQKKSEYNDGMINNFYVNDENEFIDLSDFSISDSQDNNNVYGNEDINIFAAKEESYNSFSFDSLDDNESFFDDLG